MSLKAFIPSGQTALTVNGLHQWDYGQKLEIHDNDLPALVEVHFACAGMTEAVVRSCTVVQGVAEAAIPDQCLEQTGPIVAWVYEVGARSGATIKTITLTVIPRARPQPAGTVPTVLSDKYTELVEAINEQVGALTEGKVTAARALKADEAANADEADHAANADHADEADHAANADALLSGDALNAAGKLDNLVTPGRYYCDYSVGTPTEGYGNVDVFVRYNLIMQAFYSWSTGDIYLRKKSADEAWTEWKKGNADKAKMLIASKIAPGEAITKPGLYMVGYSSTTQNIEYTDMLNISNLSNTCYANIGGYVPADSSISLRYKGAMYDADTGHIILANWADNIQITTIWLLAAYE